MTTNRLDREIADIQAREHLFDGPYDTSAKPTDALRMVFVQPYAHAFSLLAGGVVGLYDMINRDASIPAIAERALTYETLTTDGNRLRLPDGATYRTIESPRPVKDADILGMSVVNTGSLHSVLQLLDLAVIPRRSADRTPGEHPLVVAGNGAMANPEPLADYLDVIALGEAEQSLTELLHTAHAHRRSPDARTGLLEQLARIPGLYVPSLYTPTYARGGGITAITPRTLTVPDRVHAQYPPIGELPDSHFVAPITDGTIATIRPVLGCLHDCSYCVLGVPAFRQAPLKLLTDYIDRLEELGVTTINISAATFTQYKHRGPLLEHIRAYADRAAQNGTTVRTIIGSVRADEMSADYLDQVVALGDFGHLYTELHLPQDRQGVITIAPEFAAPDLVAAYGKTMKQHRVDKALDLVRANGRIGAVMLYFIVGAPGETESDRLAIADYAARVHQRLGGDVRVLVKLTQFMPAPGTPSQRLEMADPARIAPYADAIRARLQTLVGDDIAATHLHVIFDETARMHREAVLKRGDRRIGHVLEDLYDSGISLDTLTRADLDEALAKHHLDFERHLRPMHGETLPWHIVNTVNPTAEERLADLIAARRRA